MWEDHCPSAIHIGLASCDTLLLPLQWTYMFIYYKQKYKIKLRNKNNEQNLLYVYLRDYGPAHLRRPWGERCLCLAASETRRFWATTRQLYVTYSKYISHLMRSFFPCHFSAVPFRCFFVRMIDRVLLIVGPVFLFFCFFFQVFLCFFIYFLQFFYFLCFFLRSLIFFF